MLNNLSTWFTLLRKAKKVINVKIFMCTWAENENSEDYEVRLENFLEYMGYVKTHTHTLKTCGFDFSLRNDSTGGIMNKKIFGYKSREKMLDNFVFFTQFCVGWKAEAIKEFCIWLCILPSLKSIEHLIYWKALEHAWWLNIDWN